MAVISTPNASLKQPVPIDPISNIKSMPEKRQILSESSRVRSMADLRLTLRHGDHAHRCHSGILAWRGGNSGRSSTRGPCQQALQSHPRVTKGDFRTVFDTGPLPTGTSVPSPRGKGGFRPLFVTATPPTGTSVASSRSHC